MHSHSAFSSAPGDPLLHVQKLSVHFATAHYTFAAVREVSFSLMAGETLCLVGESGCGKTMTQLAVLGLCPPTAKVSGTGLHFQGTNLLGLDKESMRQKRGKDFSMIFQEPMSALNPVLSIGEQAIEGLITHQGLSRKAALERMAGLFEQVGIAEAGQRLKDYPHHLSGGMRQRVMIAMALSCNPSLLLADEPTTALDVTIQGQILALLRQQSADKGMGLLLITHDLGVVAEIADTVGVMYAGELVETAPVDAFFTQTLHPYSTGLCRSIPDAAHRSRASRLEAIQGVVPGPGARPQGCAFAPRCPHRMPHCIQEPPFTALDGSRQVRCWLYCEAP